MKNILLLCNSNNGMTQRLALELRALKHKVNVQLALSEAEMEFAFRKLKPDLVLCPFLTKKVPESIFRSQTPCIIVHPGIKGDRGVSSLDWAIMNKEKKWGVTFLSAIEEMDAGPIWSSSEFEVPLVTTKGSLYRTRVIPAAVKALEEMLDKLNNSISPEPLDYSNANIKGRLMPTMKKESRNINWLEDSLDLVMRKIRSSDSSPGAIAEIKGEKFRLFNPFIEEEWVPDQNYQNLPLGSIVGHRNEAILVKTRDAPIWISHLLKEKGLKIPAMRYFNSESILAMKEPAIIRKTFPKTFQEIWVEITGQIAQIRFNFLNGAMNTEQLLRLQTTIENMSLKEEIKIIVLRGTKDFFSNGINLCTIQAARDPTLESNRNITAMNDFIKAILSIKDKVIVSYFEGNAGAGGVMLALAADLVLAQKGVVLNPHYKTMGLFGSEYWTFNLQKRVGEKMAFKLTNDCLPVLAREMISIGLINEIINSEQDFQNFLGNLCRKAEDILSQKQKQRKSGWFEVLETHRAYEMRKMKENFKHQDYCIARNNFVFKKCPKSMIPFPVFSDNSIKRKIDVDKFIEEKLSQIIQPKLKILKEKFNIIPNITILQLEANLESNIYVSNKIKTFNKVGFKTNHIHFFKKDFGDNLEQKLLETIQNLNKDPNVHGVILQLPLPEDINSKIIFEAIDPLKDIDGFSVINTGKIALSNFFERFSLPCAVRAIIELMKYYSIKIQGRNFVVIGKGITIGLPINLYLIGNGATVTICDLQTQRSKLADYVRTADVVIAAADNYHVIDPDWIGHQTIVFDAGTKVLIDEKSRKKKIQGNLQGENLQQGFYTSVPGGIGKVTVTMAMLNTLDMIDIMRIEK